jgi:hypothetical protein
MSDYDTDTQAYGRPPEPNPELRSLDRLVGTWEVSGDTLRIWAGERDSPAYFDGTFGADDDTLTVAWHYPGGGGYEAVSTRVE